MSFFQYSLFFGVITILSYEPSISLHRSDTVPPSLSLSSLLLHLAVFSWSGGGDAQGTGGRRGTVGQFLVRDQQHGTVGTVYGRLCAVCVLVAHDVTWTIFDICQCK